MALFAASVSAPPVAAQTPPSVAADEALLPDDAAPAAPAASPDQSPPTAALTGPVAGWRLIEGDGVLGVLRLSEVSYFGRRERPLGFFSLRIEGEGVFEGLYNIREDGRGAVGVFWPDGRFRAGDAAGYLDLSVDALGAGVATATLLSGPVYEDLAVR